MRNRSDAFARGAVVVLPAFDWAWLSQVGGGRQTVIVIALASIAIVALLVASAAYLNGQRRRPRNSEDDEELLTSTPFPVPTDELRRAKDSPHHAFSTLRLPRWVQAGSLLVALGITWAVAQRLKPDDGLTVTRDEKALARAADRPRDEAGESPEGLDPAPDSSAAFAFRARDWVARAGGGCAGHLEVTKGEPNAWNLTARVHDEKGQLIDTARARVATLRQGDVVEFSFPLADCDRIGAWDVRGARRTP